MKFAVYPNIYKDKNLDVSDKVIKLLKSHNSEIYLPNEFNGHFDGLLYGKEEDICNKADFIIVIGGDGTIIKYARYAAPHRVPVVSVNLGKIGYLASINPEETDYLHRLFDRSYTISERLMLRADINGTEYTAVNDFIVSGQSVSQMIKISLTTDSGERIDYMCTGLVISTPTGSTAYNLSAGGAVIDPRLDSISVTPICPHGFTQQSIVFAPDTLFTLQNTSTPDKTLYISADGTLDIPFYSKNSIKISACEYKAQFVFFYETGIIKRLNEKVK